jgi:hypothetical protein
MSIAMLILLVGFVLLVVHASGRTGMPLWPAVLCLFLLYLLPLVR